MLATLNCGALNTSRGFEVRTCQRHVSLAAAAPRLRARLACRAALQARLGPSAAVCTPAKIRRRRSPGALSALPAPASVPLLALVLPATLLAVVGLALLALCAHTLLLLSKTLRDLQTCLLDVSAASLGVGVAADKVVLACAAVETLSRDLHSDLSLTRDGLRSAITEPLSSLQSSVDDWRKQVKAQAEPVVAVTSVLAGRAQGALIASAAALLAAAAALFSAVL